jgi:hypothetical protein
MFLLSRIIVPLCLSPLKGRGFGSHESWLSMPDDVSSGHVMDHNIGENWFALDLLVYRKPIGLI